MLVVAVTFLFLADRRSDRYPKWTGTSRRELEAGGLVVAVFALALVFACLFLVA